MDLWYTEYHTPDIRFSVRIKRHIASAESEFQRIDILDTAEFGRILVLDGFLMLTEKDEFIYHEMITHIPMAVRPETRRVLVVGAGDGGTVRELTRYAGIEHIDMVEIDKMVVDMCREHLPQTACALCDPRLSLYYEDGLKFIRTKTNAYDLIIVDSTDPFGPGEGLFAREFYGNCHNALKSGGILINQHESAFYQNDRDIVARVHGRIGAIFPVSRLYQAHIPTYPSGHWLFGFASKGPDPVNDLKSGAWNALGLKTRYYNTDLHKGAFMLPNYVRELLTQSGD